MNSCRSQFSLYTLKLEITCAQINPIETDPVFFFLMSVVLLAIFLHNVDDVDDKIFGTCYFISFQSLFDMHGRTCSNWRHLWGWSGVVKLSCILRHRGVQLKSGLQLGKILFNWQNLRHCCWSFAISIPKAMTIFFLFFLENRFWHYMQIVSIGDNLHVNVKTCFLGKIRKIFLNVCWNFYPEY